MANLALNLPNKRVSAWMAETDPADARAWLASLPLADNAETARELYQALYTLNRQDLDVTRRFELMELYIAPVASVTTALESFFTRAALPLTPKKRQLAEFIRQLHMEMAYGYKGCLQDLEKQRLRWGKKSLRALALVRALHYLGEVLLHSYQVYMPYPPEVWRELHAMYRHAVENNLDAELVAAHPPATDKTTLMHEYIRVLMLGLCNPYQLPQGECRQIQRFLLQWGGKALIQEKAEAQQQAGYFLINPEADAPPVPFPAEVPPPNQGMSLLNTVELLRTIYFFIQRLQQGDSARKLSIGIECLDTVCLDMMQRMIRSWGQLPRRQFSRIARSGTAFICAGVPAMHFFASGQKPFTPPVVAARRETADDRVILPSHIEEDITREARADEEEFIELDEPVTVGPMPQWEAPAASVSSGEEFRVDRWQIKDAAPKGLQLVRVGSSHTYVRVGDAIGLQQMDEIGRWSVGVVRWMKSPEAGSLEMGVELLASGAQPVAVAPHAGSAEYQPALLLPAIEALRRPATLLLPRGVFAPGGNLLLAESGSEVRTVRLLQRLEYTNVFELLVFADVNSEHARG